MSRLHSSRMLRAVRRLRRTAGYAAFIAASMAGGTTSVVAQDKTVSMTVSLWVPPAHPLVPATQAWAADIEKSSGGTIKMSVFPSEQIGKAFDHYDMARDGIADVTWVNPGYQPGRFPIIAEAAIPFTFSDAKRGTLALDAWYRKYAPSEMKEVHFCFAFLHELGQWHGTKKVFVPEDIKGLKVRPAQSSIGALVRLLGGTNVQASVTESRDAIERGVADATTFPSGTIILFGIDKVTKFHMDVPLYSTPLVYAINPAKYNSLSANQKKVIDDHCTPEWASKVSDPWVDFEASGYTKLKALPGHEFYALTPEQLAAWKKATRPLHEAWAESVKSAGRDPQSVDADFKAALSKYNAAF